MISEIRRNYSFVLIAGLFLLISILFITNDITGGIPAFIFLTVLSLIGFFSGIKLKYNYYFLALSIPLSVEADISGTESSLILISEPYMLILAGVVFLQSVLQKPAFTKYQSWVLRYFTLLLISTLILTAFSSMPEISLKRSVMNLFYGIVYFYLPLELMLKKEIKIKTAILFYCFSLFIAGCYIFLKHYKAGLNPDSSAFATKPFFSDHTIYSACLAMVIPFLFLNEGNSKKGIIIRLVSFLAGLILCIFLFYTYSRAAWISLLGALTIVLLALCGFRYKYLLTLSMAGIIALIVLNNEFNFLLKQNRYDSNARHATLADQTKSVTNITSDQSNAERINRWKCAVRMFGVKPLTGFGPGTYQFQYLSFQRKREMTRISVTTPFNHVQGKGGSAHSEYLLLLSENGFSGILLYLLLINSCFIILFRNIQKKGNTNKALNVILLFSFSTYVIHGFFNNFLDTDKAAMLFYLLLAGIVYANIVNGKGEPVKSEVSAFA